MWRYRNWVMLNLSDRVKNDLSSNIYSLTPLIVLNAPFGDYYALQMAETSPSTADSYSSSIFISTTKQAFKLTHSQAENNIVYWDDANLRISNIKESIDIQNRNFKINNVSFTLSNVSRGDKKLTDILSEKNITNKNAQVFYQTPSCQSLEDCIFVYSGVVRKFKHDLNKISIELEDLTEDHLSQTFPLANTGFGEHVMRKEEENKPIPAVYGHVEKSPAIQHRVINYEANDFSSTLKVIPDDTLNATRNISIDSFGGQNQYNMQFEGSNSPLFLYKGDYYQVARNFNNDVMHTDAEEFGNWDSDFQYSVDNDSINKVELFSVGAEITESSK